MIAHYFQHLLHYTNGIGLELGAFSPVNPLSLVINTDGRPTIDNPTIFKNKSLDYLVFGNILYNYGDWWPFLREWLPLLKDNGHLIVAALDSRKSDDFPIPPSPPICPKSLLELLSEQYNVTVKQSLIDDDTKSFALVCSIRRSKNSQIDYAIEQYGDDDIVMMRFGAFGDAIQATSLVNRLAAEGKSVVVKTSNRGAKIFEHNPKIKRIEVIPEKSLSGERYERYLSYCQKTFGDRFINLNTIIEQTLLKIPACHDYNLPLKLRHAVSDINYLDAIHMVAGYDDAAGWPMEMYFNEIEEQWAKKFLAPYHGKFIVVWAWTGSGCNKRYPWGQLVMSDFLRQCHDAIIITVGDDICRLLDFDHPSVICTSGKLSIRQSCLLTKYADLVVGPETGVINAAACFNTPTVIIMSHSSRKNLAKYMPNAVCLNANIPCYPCHRLIYSPEDCHPLDRDFDRLYLLKVLSKMQEILGQVTNNIDNEIKMMEDAIRRVSDCMIYLDPDVVVDAMKTVYLRKFGGLNGLDSLQGAFGAVGYS